MSQQKKLERVLNLLLSEDSDQAAELLHQIIVEKARTIYESIVDEEDVDESDEDKELDESDEVGGDPEKNFTDEISTHEDDIDSDEEFGGEPEGEDDSEGSDDEFGGEDDSEGSDDEFGGEEGEGSTEERIEDLESQLSELRAEFDALMGEELEEPNHADLGDEMGEIESDFGDQGNEFGGAMGGDQGGFGNEQESAMFEKKKADKKALDEKKEKLEKAAQAKDKKKDKKVDEETQFLNKVADTGQKGTAKLVGTGKGMTLGAEQNKSPYTYVPPRKDSGGKPAKIGSGTGGEYGKWNGDSAKDETITDNVKIEPKKNSVKADTTPKYTGGKAAGEGGSKTPFLKKPS